jgi:hypothetical protein
MNYCSSCYKVHESTVEKCCYSFATMKVLPIEAKCKCGGTVDLKFHKPWQCGDYEYGNYCECGECRAKNEARQRH